MAVGDGHSLGPLPRTIRSIHGRETQADDVIYPMQPSGTAVKSCGGLWSQSVSRLRGSAVLSVSLYLFIYILAFLICCIMSLSCFHSFRFQNPSRDVTPCFYAPLSSVVHVRMRGVQRDATDKWSGSQHHGHISVRLWWMSSASRTSEWPISTFLSLSFTSCFPPLTSVWLLFGIYTLCLCFLASLS